MAVQELAQQAAERAKLRQGAALFVLLVAPVAPLLAFAADCPGWVTGLLAVPVPIVLHWCVREHGGWRLFGPHCYFDLIRMARKGRTVLFRVLFLLALLAGIWYTYEKHRPEEPEFDWRRLKIGGVQLAQDEPNMRNQLARFNAECVYAWFLLQNLTILILTPAYFGGAIAEERERGTLELLHTSGLYNREIILGKLAARVLHLGAFLLAGLPVFSLMLVWGGIDLTLLLGGWFNSVLLLIAAGSICLMISTMPYSSTACVITSYVVLLVFGGCCSGMWGSIAWLTGTGSFAAIEEWLLIAGGYCAIITFCLAVTIQAIRSNDLPPTLHELRTWDTAGWTRLDPAALADAAIVPVADRTQHLEPWWPPLPPVTDNALLWKEQHASGRAMVERPEVLISGGTIVACTLFISFAVAVGQVKGAHSVGEFLHRFTETWTVSLPALYGIFVVCYAIGVAFRAAGCVVRERQMQTLDALLTLPIDRRDILRAKWLGSLLKGRLWLAFIAADVVLGMAMGRYHPVSVIYLLVGPWPLVLFLCNVGLLISVVARTSLQAHLVMAGVLAAVAIGVASVRPGLLLGFNSLTFSWWDWEGISTEELAIAGIAAFGFGGAATCAWTATAALFDRPPRRLQVSGGRDPDR
jgi:ABC-type transport system involved in multi-copper enzyme maturation permease subunit